MEYKNIRIILDFSQFSDVPAVDETQGDRGQATYMMPGAGADILASDPCVKMRITTAVMIVEVLVGQALAARSLRFHSELTSDSPAASAPPRPRPPKAQPSSVAGAAAEPAPHEQAGLRSDTAFGVREFGSDVRRPFLLRTTAARTAASVAPPPAAAAPRCGRGRGTKRGGAVAKRARGRETER